MSNIDRIPEETLAEQWFSFIHDLIGKMQAAFRSAGIAQKTIAKRLGKKESFISRCLSGQQNMTIRTIFYLARAMGFRLEIRFRRLSTLKPTNNRPSLLSEEAITPFPSNVARTEAAATSGIRQFARVE